MTDEAKGGLSASDAQRRFNDDIQTGRVKPQSLEEYIKLGQAAGAIPQNLTDAQRAEVAKIFNRVKQG